jgi:hypothetical protein
MSVPDEPLEKAVALKSGYRWQLDRAISANTYLRVFFSTLLLLYAVFGPGVLLRFPASGGGVGFEPVSRFYAFRPVLYALMFVVLVCVLAALAKRALDLFEATLAVDTTEATGVSERDRYIRRLKPSPLPLVLSGHGLVDLLILGAILVAYSFWIVLLVETIPPGMGGYAVAGIVLGSYGLFGAMIVCLWVWLALTARGRRLLRGT